MQKLSLRLAALALASTALTTAPAYGQDAATEAAVADEANTWDLTPFYPTKEAWDAEFDRLRANIEGLAPYKGKLGDSSATLLEALELRSAFTKELSRMGTYASNSRNTNLGDPAGQEMLGRLQALGRAAGANSAFFVPEVAGLGEEKLMAFIAEEPGLEKHSFFLLNVLRQSEHVLSPETEQTLTLLSGAIGASQNVRDLLANAEIEWPTITLSDGTEAVISTSGYARYRQAPNRADRIATFGAFWGTWKKYESTLGAALNGEVQGNVGAAKARGYENTLEYFLSGDNIPQEVYRTLVEVTNDRIDVLHRYFALRARMLEIEDLGYHDIYPSLVETDLTFPIDETREHVLASMQPLGDEFVSKFDAASQARWMHVYPQPGKRSGAYMSGAAYDVHPLILLNHLDDYNSASTYAHEWGHAMHQVLTNENQPYELANFSIFTTEIAAIAQELMLADHMLENAKDDNERLFYLGNSLEQMRGTFFRQVMFSEFEVAVHEAVERGEALTGARMTKIYGDILKRYHGHEQGVMEITDREAIEWAYIPHFYFNFYVYQYATSIAGAAYFVDQIKENGDSARDTYINFLKAGGSNYPTEILKDAGLDMSTRAPYDAVIDRMDAVMDEIETILERQGK
jgi:oligoendopeptidase F